MSSIYISSNNIISTSDYLLTSDYVVSLTPGSTSTETANINLAWSTFNNIPNGQEVLDAIGIKT